MKELTSLEVNLVSGGTDSITGTCFEAVNLYANWWFYGIIFPETFVSTYLGYCSPDTILVIESNQLDIIACAPQQYAETIYSSCCC